MPFSFFFWPSWPKMFLFRCWYSSIVSLFYFFRVSICTFVFCICISKWSTKCFEVYFTHTQDTVPSGWLWWSVVIPSLCVYMYAKCHFPRCLFVFFLDASLPWHGTASKQVIIQHGTYASFFLTHIISDYTWNLCTHFQAAPLRRVS